MFWKYIQDIIKSKLEYNIITTLDLRDCYVKLHVYIASVPIFHTLPSQNVE